MAQTKTTAKGKAKTAPKAKAAPETAAKTKPKGPGGRPRFELDDEGLEELRKLAGLGCTYDDVAAWFKVSRETIIRRMKEPRFRDAWEQGQGRGRVSLRRTQFELAKRSATMAIFLGKQILGQRDVVDQRLTGPGGGPLEMTVAGLMESVSGASRAGPSGG